jgi:pimeloyl-ACP methyl ester carboxylesterase
VRRVHYRRQGQGPALLLVHQSPKNSAEFAGLMARWSRHFTCIAPDTPGFGQSQALPGEPEIGDFADALLATMEALNLRRASAYGFHSGAVILMEALQRDPQRFSGVALGGYAVWTPEETALFGSRYLPPFQPQPFGEHLAWLWNRMLEQSWFFPWFATDQQARLNVAYDDPVRVHANVMDMLDAGDAYRSGYGAVLRAERAIPRQGPPTLITAYDGDPLQAHLERLGQLPPGWQARPVRSREEHEEASLAWLLDAAAGQAPAPVEAADEGFEAIDGRLIHWLGRGDRLRLHGPGGEARVGTGIAVDLPGHGLSDDHHAAEPWADTLRLIGRTFAVRHFEAEGATGALLGGPPARDGDRLVPDLAPQRFGEHLQRAWGTARATRLFDPWYEVSAATARDFAPGELEPERIALDARALLRARGGRSLAAACARGG